MQHIVLPQYSGFLSRATALNNSLITLSESPTNANLIAAQQAWRNTRSVWEQCEGFLIGPVEDNNYDRDMDTCPIDYRQPFVV